MTQFSKLLRALLVPLALCACGSLHAATTTDDAVTVTKDAETPFNVLANDTGTDLGVTAATAPANGTVILFGGGVRYKPTVGFTGTDSFSYTVRDGYRFGVVQRSPLTTIGGVAVQGSGWGSALAKVPGSNDYYLLTDRGPNTDADDGTNKVFPVPSFSPKIGRFARQTDGSFKLVGAPITLKRPDGTPITGLPNPSAPSGEIAFAIGGGAIAFTPDVAGTGGQDTFGLDTEGLAVDAGGNFWVCDEYGPFLVQFDSTGTEIERVSPYALNGMMRKFPRVLGNRRNNRGMEGLCITPSGKLVGMMQNALNKKADGSPITNGDNNRTATLRIVVYDPTTGVSQQYIYLSTIPNVSNSIRVSEIACINETKFLVLERDDAPPPTGTYKKIYEIDITGATDVSGDRDMTGDHIMGDPTNGKLWKRTSDNVINNLEELCRRQDTATAAATLAALKNPVSDAADPVVPVSKTEKFDIFANVGSSYSHEKIEGLAVLTTTGMGATETPTKIVIVNDDDFGLNAAAIDAANPNRIAIKFNGQGVQDFNEVLEIDLTATGTATGTVNVTVAPTTPYIVPVAAGVETSTILTVGDSVNLKPDAVTPYRMVGIPDGLGAFDNGDGTFTLLMNHELVTSVGVERAHGNKGAFVSRWVINKSTLKVQSIQDHNPNNTSIFTWNGTAYNPAGTATYGRFCSADLPAASAFYNAANDKGTTERIFMTGEENGPEGRAFGHIVTGPNKGQSYELPHLGKFSYENALACPQTQDKTIVISTDDATPGQVYVYVGTKKTTGTEVNKAGLTGGTLFGVFANGIASEDRDTAVGGLKGAAVPFVLTSLGDVSAMTGAQLETTSGVTVTKFLRPEDGAWDPSNPADFYFVTTDRFDSVKNGGVGTQPGRSRLWRLRFTDIASPEIGGMITMLIDGTENPGPNMLDNMTVDGKGRVVMQEDPGEQDHNAKIWVYHIDSGVLSLVAKHDPARFGEALNGVVTPPTSPFSIDEESSGIIDVSDILGENRFLLVQQAHKGTLPEAELAERGQLLSMTIPPIAPTVSAIIDTTINEDAATTALPFTVGDSAFTAASMTLTAESSNPALVLESGLLFGGDGNSRTITVTPVANQSGTAVITVTAFDGAENSASTSFTLTVLPVNDVPSFTKGPDQAVTEDAGPQTVTGWATAISAGPSDEVGQALAFIVTTSNDALFLVKPSVSRDGVLTYTPTINANGSATVTVTLMDNGGTTNGGVDTSSAQTFTLAVAAATDSPVVTSRPTATPNPATPGQAVSFAAAATTVDGGALTFSWAFGDGTSGTGASVSHTYAAANVYTVTLTVSGGGNLTATETLLVAVVASGSGGASADLDADGTPDAFDTDDDNDGYSDSVEQSMGTNPSSSDSRPGNQSVATVGGAFRDVKLSIKLSFGKPNADSLSLKGALPGVSGATDGQVVIVDVGGVSKSFTLTGGKSEKSKTESFKLGKGGAFSFSLKKVAIASDLEDESLTDRNADGETVNVVVTIISGSKSYEASISGAYKARAGKGGAFK